MPPTHDRAAAVSGDTRPGPLHGISVIELADRPGAFAAKLLGDLGADVVKIEPPGGDTLRAHGPFWREEPHPDRSLGFWFYNTSKRSVILDLAHVEGRAAALRLAAGADVVIHSGDAGILERLGLGYDVLRHTNPGVVLACITPFGETGPRRGWRTSAIVAEAVSGMLYVSGFPDEPPVATAGTQAYHATGAYAAIAVLAALLARERDGPGQRIDVSVQEASAAAVEHVASLFHQTGRVYRRAGSLHWTRYFRAARCRDGYVLHSSLGDWTSLLAWVEADGKAQDLGDPQWEDFNHRRRHCEHLFDVLDLWVRDHDVAELMTGAQLRRIPYAAVRPPEELPADPHLVERGFFVPVHHPELGITVRHPGAPYRFGATPWAIRRRPPLLGEHTDEILGSPAAAAGPSGGDGDALHTRRPHDVGPALRPLDGVRVLDFTWVVAGPTATRLLADLGAEVIKIERRDALDFGDRRGGFTGSLNRGKLGMVVNLADPRGLDIARRLVATADVVIDNFSARVMGNWGLDYAGLRAIRPDVIAVSMSGFGLTGPYRDYVSYGPTLQALAGYTSLMRHPGGEPAGFGFSYADIVGGFTAALAVLAALWHRRRSGEGQMIDLSQFEAVCSMLGPLLLEITANGRPIVPAGNTSQEGTAAPHGVYRCAGEDRWCAIAVLDQEEWHRFAGALGNPAWCRDPRFATPADRVHNRAELDGLVAAWTCGQSAEAVTARLQGAGVRAGVVASGEDLCLSDPQLEAREYWTRLDTPEGVPVSLDGIPYRLERTPARVSGPGPLLGEHTDTVLGRLLGLSDSEIAALRAARVVA